MARTEIFETKFDFEQRENKEINGVSPEFAKENKNWRSINENNEGCWNCFNCCYCSNCSDCTYSNRLSFCDDCHYSYNCFKCVNCHYCEHCFKCNDSMMNFSCSYSDFITFSDNCRNSKELSHSFFVKGLKDECCKSPENYFETDLAHHIITDNDRINIDDNEDFE